jgi:ADP-ribose pyrophosphatase YjhB (NUDIX family)
LFARSTTGSHYRPPGRSEKVSFSFLAEAWSGEPQVIETDRSSATGWFPVDNLPQSTMPQAVEAIRLFRAGEHFSTYGLP